MEDAESAEKQENTGIGPASASPGRGAPLIRDRHRLKRSTQVGFTRLAHISSPISGKPEIGVCSAPPRPAKTGVNALEVLRCARDTRAPLPSICALPLGEQSTNLWVWKRPSPWRPLFPACYLQGTAQLQRVNVSAALAHPGGGEAADQEQEPDQSAEHRQHADAAHHARLARAQSRSEERRVGKEGG